MPSAFVEGLALATERHQQKRIRQRQRTTVCNGSIWSLPPSRSSPEEEFRRQARKLEEKEIELQRKAKDVVLVEHKNKRMFAEVVQHVKARDMYWLRPFLLQHIDNPTSYMRDCNGLEWESASENTMFDLRGLSDVFLPDCFAETLLPEPTRVAVELILMTYGEKVVSEDSPDGAVARASSAMLAMLREMSEDHPDLFQQQRYHWKSSSDGDQNS